MSQPMHNRYSDCEELRPTGEASHIPDQRLDDGCEGDTRRQRVATTTGGYPDEPSTTDGECRSCGASVPDGQTKCRFCLTNHLGSDDTSTDELLDILKKTCGYQSRIVADSAERRLIRDYYYKGLNIHRADKRIPVKTQIKHLQSYEIVVDIDSIDWIFTQDGKEFNYNLINCFDNYSWHDKKAGLIKHEYSDPMDSWRYIAIDLLGIK